MSSIASCLNRRTPCYVRAHQQHCIERFVPALSPSSPMVRSGHNHSRSCRDRPTHIVEVWRPVTACRTMRQEARVSREWWLILCCGITIQATSALSGALWLQPCTRLYPGVPFMRTQHYLPAAHIRSSSQRCFSVTNETLIVRPLQQPEPNLCIDLSYVAVLAATSSVCMQMYRPVSFWDYHLLVHRCFKPKVHP